MNIRKKNNIINNQTQKGKIPLLKLNYIKKGFIGIYSKYGFILNDNIIKSIKLDLKLTPKITIYKREGTRMGKGKSKIISFGYRIKKGFNLINININNNYKNLKKNIEYYKNIKKIYIKLTKIINRLPFLKIIWK